MTNINIIRFNDRFNNFLDNININRDEENFLDDVMKKALSLMTRIFFSRILKMRIK